MNDAELAIQRCTLSGIERLERKGELVFKLSDLRLRLDTKIWIFFLDF